MSSSSSPAAAAAIKYGGGGGKKHTTVFVFFAAKTIKQYKKYAMHRSIALAQLWMYVCTLYAQFKAVELH